MTNNIKNTTQEVIKIINELKIKVDNHQTWTGTEKTDLEKRLAHLLDKTQPEGTVKLDTDLTELENIDNILANAISQAAQDLKKVQTDLLLMTNERNTKETELQAEKDKVTAKETELAAKIAEIAGLSEAKITQELITKINTLAASAYDPTKIAEIKTLLEAVKTKTDQPQEVDTSKLKEELKKELPEKWTGWAILAVLGGTFLGVIYLAFFKPSNPESEAEKLVRRDSEL